MRRFVSTTTHPRRPQQGGGCIHHDCDPPQATLSGDVLERAGDQLVNPAAVSDTSATRDHMHDLVGLRVHNIDRFASDDHLA